MIMEDEFFFFTNQSRGVHAFQKSLASIIVWEGFLSPPSSDSKEISPKSSFPKTHHLYLSAVRMSRHLGFSKVIAVLEILAVT